MRIRGGGRRLAHRAVAAECAEDRVEKAHGSAPVMLGRCRRAERRAAGQNTACSIDAPPAAGANAELRRGAEQRRQNAVTTIVRRFRGGGLRLILGVPASTLVNSLIMSGP